MAELEPNIFTLMLKPKFYSSSSLGLFAKIRSLAASSVAKTVKTFFSCEMVKSLSTKEVTSLRINAPPFSV